MHKPKHALTRKQERYIREYMADLNATQAAIRAGYSQQNADKIGPELLGETRFHIDQALREMAQRTTMTAEEIVNKLQCIANTDIAAFMSWDGKTETLTLKDPDEIPKELRQCIESITQHETQHAKYLKIKLHSKVAALGMLAKYHNLFKRTIASKGLNVHIHVAAGPQAQKAPIVVNPKENGHKTIEASKATFAFAPGGTDGGGAAAKPGGETKRTEHTKSLGTKPMHFIAIRQNTFTLVRQVRSSR